MQTILDNILNTNSKISIIRLFVSKRNDYIATGREISKIVKMSPPATHASLKELYNQDILKREIIGRQHIYSINVKNRIVKDILVPAFRKESAVKDDIIRFLKNKIESADIKKEIFSMLLYGSIQTGVIREKGDADVAVVVKNEKDIKEVENVFSENISEQFKEYFGINLDTYVKSENEFRKRMNKKLPPVSTLMQSYSIIYGKDPLDF